MANIAYYRVSAADQSIESQRHDLGGPFDREFSDEATSGATVAMTRPGFSAMADYMRDGDTVFVTAIDRLGRDSIDIQTTYRDQFKGRGIRLYVQGLGYVEGEIGEVVLNLMAQFAEMERRRIVARTSAGRETAREVFARTGRTHRGKTILTGRPMAHDPEAVRAWREDNKASIAQTARQFGICLTTVKSYCRAR
ncbi:recombinase family protein [Novosphingobium mangrovi (ex Hu et al. 2023)]|uniref:Recombinase family protein n=1 Tax=Novosphingobium mangrovi (ex Hu et al. 2023) TaxID=2930094 RepID=A0ABT0AG60_9SPHN|nr:recombinase family protein [Novosphingobium mangrovi (ex Hu et al. 2023)]MCJ1962185.1 recombinase family protein [Novosphingobium mangrovi (ex Hu et al. 2023)]